MAETKYKRLVSSIRNFHKKILAEVEIKEKIYCSQGWGDSSNCIIMFEKEAWLHCETYDEIQNRWSRSLIVKQRIQEQNQIPESMLRWLEKEAKPIYEQWLFDKNSCRHTNEIKKKNYYFSPLENEPMDLFLRRLVLYIDEEKRVYLRRLVLDLYKYCIYNLLQGRLQEDFDYEYFLREKGLSQTRMISCMTPLKLKPTRYPVSEARMVEYLKWFVQEILSKPRCGKTIVESLLVLWGCLAVAFHERRWCTIEDILKLRYGSLGYTQGECIYDKDEVSEILSVPKGRRIRLKNRDVVISQTFYDMLECFFDQRKSDDGLIFSVDRSTVENHLRNATEALGYDFKNDPVSPETFLEVPHLWRDNYRPGPFSSY